MGSGTNGVTTSGVLYVGVDQRDTYYNGPPGNPINAELAFFGLWNTVLTPTQIQAFYTANSAQFGTFV
jgi:hypothetical protein